MNYIKLTIIICVVKITSLTAQVNIKDSLVNITLIGASYSFQAPGGDLAQRYGLNSNAGISLMNKTKKNWIIGLDANYLWGNDIKISLFTHLKTTEGYIINNVGEYATMRLYESGIEGSGKIGKIFPAFGPNKNSGIMTTLGVGFLQHKVKIVVPNSNVYQLAGNYKKGYDKLTNGIAFTEFVGYLFLSNNRMVNFYGGLEFTQAFTKSARSYDFDLRAADTRKRNDLLYGIRVGWILPIYRKSAEDFYDY